MRRENRRVEEEVFATQLHLLYLGRIFIFFSQSQIDLTIQLLPYVHSNH